MTEKIIDELINLSEKKLEYLNNILNLTKIQKKIIDEEDMLKNDEILDKKDEIIKKIDKLDVDFLIKFSSLKKKNNIDKLEELNVEDFPNLKKLKEVTKNTTSILMAISLLDDENNKALKNSLKNIKSGLKTLKKGKKAYKGYKNSMDVNSLFIDEKK